jgi:hypothetical protein
MKEHFNPPKWEDDVMDHGEDSDVVTPGGCFVENPPSTTPSVESLSGVNITPPASIHEGTYLHYRAVLNRHVLYSALYAALQIPQFLLQQIQLMSTTMALGVGSQSSPQPMCSRVRE